jgi:hypothetical protein
MTGPEFEGLLTHLDALLTEFEQHPDAVVSARAMEMIQLVDAVHREALGRLVALAGRRNPRWIEEAACDPVVRILLALYDLAPGAEDHRAFIPLAQLEASALAARARGEERR